MSSDVLDFVCNQCAKQLEEGEKAAATTCKHLFCFQCAQQLVQSGSNCPTCDEMLTKNTMKVVQVLQAPAKVNSQLVGQRPEIAIDAAKEAVQFFLEQMVLTRAMVNEDWMRRIENVQARCKEKLDNIYNAYKQLKVSESQAQKDLQELQDKYQLKARQLREARGETDQLKAQLQNARQMMGMGAVVQQHPVRHALPAPSHMHPHPHHAISPPMGFGPGAGGPGGGRMHLGDSRLMNSPNGASLGLVSPPHNLGFGGKGMEGQLNFGGGGQGNAVRGSNQLRRVMDPAMGGFGAHGHGHSGGYGQENQLGMGLVAMQPGGTMGGGGKVAANRNPNGARGNNNFFSGASF